MFAGGPYAFPFFGLSYEELDIAAPDITENELMSIGNCYRVEHLGQRSFPQADSSADGQIFGLNKRLMVPLICQSVGEKPEKPSVAVWFLVDTSSPYTCLTKKSLKTIFGAEKKKLLRAIFSTFLSMTGVTKCYVEFLSSISRKPTFSE